MGGFLYQCFLFLCSFFCWSSKDPHQLPTVCQWSVEWRNGLALSTQDICRWTKKTKNKTKHLQCICKQTESSSAPFLQMALKRAQRNPMTYLEGPGVFCPVAEGPYAPLLCSSEQSNERISGHRPEIWKAVLLNWGFIKDHRKLFGP